MFPLLIVIFLQYTSANEIVRVAEAGLVSDHLSVRNSCVQTLWLSSYFEVARSYGRSCGNQHLQLYTIWIDDDFQWYPEAMLHREEYFCFASRCTEQGIISLNVAAATESTFCLLCAYGRCSSRSSRLCSIKVLLSSKTLLDLIICREVRWSVKACKGDGVKQPRLVGPFKCRVIEPQQFSLRDCWRAVSNSDCATVFFGVNLTDDLSRDCPDLSTE
ncbi:hypothetical transcript [Echinococcus multilocularis]|uniref:Hypothetical transcript n=1 Tax=Echinococcus multilocularis TaxID=6211 RepID=A0A0S4MKS9_ECHMU|nr:hypothetical transcript [Echinococcus multilocularis]